MFLNAVKGSSPLLLILIPIIAFFLWFKAIFDPYPVLAHSVHMPLYNLLTQAFNNNFFWLNILALLFLITAAYSLIWLNRKYVFIKNRIILPALIYILIITSIISLQGMHPAIPAGILLILSINSILGIYKNDNPIALSYDAGLYIGLSSLFYLNAVSYLVWFWFSLLVLGHSRGREFFSGLAGFLTPFFFTFGWYLWNDRLLQLWYILSVNWNQPGISIGFSDIEWGYLIFLALLVFFSILFLLFIYQEKRAIFRKHFRIILWFFGFNIASYFLFPSSGWEHYFLAAIPMAYIISYYFLQQKIRWIKEIFFFLFLLATIAVHLLPENILSLIK